MPPGVGRLAGCGERQCDLGGVTQWGGRGDGFADGLGAGATGTIGHPLQVAQINVAILIYVLLGYIKGIADAAGPMQGQQLHIG